MFEGVRTFLVSFISIFLVNWMNIINMSEIFRNIGQLLIILLTIIYLAGKIFIQKTKYEEEKKNRQKKHW
jgi:hypothetical protein